MLKSVTTAQNILPLPLSCNEEKDTYYPKSICVAMDQNINRLAFVTKYGTVPYAASHTTVKLLKQDRIPHCTSQSTHKETAEPGGLPVYLYQPVS